MRELYTQYILEKIAAAGQQYNTKGERLLYEQGILIGLLLLLAEHDSKNFDIIRKRLENLK